jgi:hypothetical protein
MATLFDDLTAPSSSRGAKTASHMATPPTTVPTLRKSFERPQSLRLPLQPHPLSVWYPSCLAARNAVFSSHLFSCRSLSQSLCLRHFFILRLWFVPTPPCAAAFVPSLLPSPSIFPCTLDVWRLRPFHDRTKLALCTPCVEMWGSSASLRWECETVQAGPTLSALRNPIVNPLQQPLSARFCYRPATSAA